MRGRGRFHTAVATATAALLCAGALAGCSSAAPEKAAPTSTATPAPTSAWDASPSSLAAVGDSITRAFDACSLLSDCPEASWATGTDTAVNSLALRLLGPEKAAGRSWNLARTGARMADLPGQMTAAAARKPELVTVMMGANDACRPTPGLMTPVAEFRASFGAALARLRAAAPEAQVYVASVPDLKHLWSTGRIGGAAGIWDLGVCGAMLADATDLGPEAERRRATVSERVDAYNGVLAEVCAKDERCRYDGGAVHAFRFDGGQLSPWDWFHPSRDGQARLAELAYRRITAG
ncbi:SGNH/GDSL hydrolase family protein [Streptomyces sp. NPDC012825]|uniref:SGNH/GDSL hydrolase family protein n=1 Tax=Streptomyces sp. NPDC012825 TaxID=3364851 RepID=UPI00369CAA87